MKETFYFSHDYGARNDPKMISLRFTIGLEAIGVYWCLIETLYEQDGKIELKFLEETIRSYGVCNTDVVRIIDKLFETQLLQKDEKIVWSDGVNLRIQKRKEKSEKARQSVLYRHNKYERNTNVIRKSTIKVKESKVKESKSYTTCSSQKMSEGQFDTFWKTYPRKVGKKKAHDKFVKLDVSLFEMIMKSLLAQTKTDQWQKENGRFIPHPITWLYQERWNDELEEQKLDISERRKL